MKYSEEEKQIVERLAKRDRVRLDAFSPKSVRYFEKGNFTVAIIKTATSELVGVAKRNPIEKPDFRIGKQVAFARAICIK